MKKAVIKAIRQFLVVLAIMSFLLVSMAATGLAADPAPSEVPQSTPEGAQTPPSQPTARPPLFPLPEASKYGNLPAPTPGTSAQYQFQQLMWGLVQNVRYILGAVAIAFIVYSGFRMVTAWGNEEVYAKQRTNILYAVIGLAVVAMSGEMSRIFAVSCPEFTAPGQTNYACTQGGFLKDPNAIVRASTIFNQQTKIIITAIKYLIGGIAVLMVVRNGLRMITMGASQEKMEQDKKNLAYSILGLGLIIVADTVISQVFYKLDLTRYPSVGGATPAIDPVRGVKEIVGFTNLIVSIVGPLAVLALLGGGIMYITAAGKEEQMTKAKRLIMAALFGILIIYGAFAIVSTFIAGNFENVAPVA